MRAQIYGIRNCDTMRKTFAWFKAAAMDYDFHDYRKEAPASALLRGWCEQLGWEALVNRRGTTWRKLSATEQDIDSIESAIALMQAHPSLIRRPLIVTASGDLLLGFDAERLQAVFVE